MTKLTPNEPAITMEDDSTAADEAVNVTRQ